MKKLALVLIAAASSAAIAQQPMMSDITAWKKQAANITITRDDWGIAHVHGKTDADAVFGMVYTQAEDDFNRVETNFMNSQGRLAEAEGEPEIWRDLRMKLFIDPDTLKEEYQASPAWLQDGDERLGGRLELLPLQPPRSEAACDYALRAVDGVVLHRGQHRGRHRAREPHTARGIVWCSGREQGDGLRPVRPRGQGLAGQGAVGLERHSDRAASHGDAPRDAADQSAHFVLLPLRAADDERRGIERACGAATWGQPFLYQGFNERAGWMHTTSGANDASNYLETVTKRGDQYFYKYGSDERPVVAFKVTVPYKTANGMAKREFTVFRTQHGPVVREQNGKWVAYKIMVEHVKALTQSYIRTKAHNYKEFQQSMELHTNSSNNTLYADADGNPDSSSGISFPSATLASTGASQWMAAIRRRIGRACSR